MQTDIDPKAAPANLLLQDVQYRIEKTRLGVWRRFVYPSGAYFAEFKSHRSYLGLPLLHYTRGVCPQTGRRIVAKGIVAVGRLAVGGLAIGHAAAGIVAVGQLGLGLAFGLGQAASGAYCLGQLAVGFLFGVGQLATGAVAIGQLGIGEYVLAQVGVGRYVWSVGHADPEAVAYFQELWARLRSWLAVR